MHVQRGDLGWTSTSTTDWDGDGCRDAGEDTDDDNDGILDSNDLCNFTPNGSIPAANGCADTDGDGVYDSLDSCLDGNTNWISNSTNDYDSDGCLDRTEWVFGGINRIIVR